MAKTTAKGLYADLTGELIRRWTAKSPKAYRIITDIALGAGLAATALLFLPVTLPAWVVPTGAFLVALGAKLTTEQPINNQNKEE